MEILFLFVVQPVTNWIDFVFMFSTSGVEEFHFTSLKCVLASKIDFGAPRQIERFGWQMQYFVPSLGENWNFSPAIYSLFIAKEVKSPVPLPSLII
jgi:hypothetical protein